MREQMEMWMVVVVVVMWLWSCGYLLRRRKRSLKLPPGPPAWPIVGCLPFLPRINPPELMFAKLAEKHGELMLLCMGSRELLVVSSARMAMEVLKTHDQVFANRPDFIANEYISFRNTALVVMQSTNPLFKPTRRMFASEIVSPRKVAMAEELRKEQVLKMLRVNIVPDLDAGRCVNFTKAVSSLAMNLAMAMNFGRDYGAKVVDDAEFLVRTFRKMMPLLHRRNLGDFFPAIRWLDAQGIEAGLNEVSVELRKNILSLIEKKKLEMSMWSAEEIQRGANERDIMSKLLSMEGEDRFSEEQLVSVVFTLLAAGTETIHRTITEALYEVVRNPHIHKQALTELDSVVGTSRLVSESDIANLPMIQNIIKETLRLHPPVPSLPPHRNFEPCELAGYHIPANCSIIINLYPIMQDPSFWDSPMEFCPNRWNDERSLKSDFHFIPFGFGKRQCPAINLGMVTAQYAVAVCMQCMSWEIPGGMESRQWAGTPEEPRKKADLVLDGKLRVHPSLLEVNA